MLPQAQLRGQLVKLELTLLVTPDVPLADVNVWVTGEDGRGGVQRTDSLGRLFVWMPTDAGACTLQTNTYRNVTIQVVAGPQLVNLVPE